LKAPLFTFLTFVAASNLWIATAAACALSTGYLFFQLPVDRKLVVFIFFATLFTYNFQRRVGDLKSSARSAKWNAFWMLVSTPFLLFLVFQLSFQTVLILGACGVLSIAYAVPFIPSSKGMLSLRLIPRMKFWVIMTVWCFSVILIPFMQAQVSALSVSIYLLMQFGFIGALTIVFDIQDLNVDLPAQRTIPQVLGVKGAVNLALAMLAASTICIVVLAYLGRVDLYLMSVHLLVALLSAMVVRKAHPKNHPLYFSILVDGLIMLQAFLLLLTEYFF
jgi:4-hydroxybenzoate polyprenyltransferase